MLQQCMNPALSIAHKALLFAAVNFVLTAVCLGQTQIKPDAQTLSANQQVKRLIKGGETQVFQFNVRVGQFARAEIEQRSIDVIVSLIDADGNVVVEMDGKDGYLWKEIVSAIAEKNDATFQVRIRAYGIAEQVGSYTIKVVELRSIETKDRQRIEGQQHLYKGIKLNSQKNPNYDVAIKEYEDSARIWHNLGETFNEAVALFNLAWAYSDSSKNEIALSKMERALALLREIEDRMGESKALNGIGVIYGELGQTEKSSQYLENSLVIRRELRDRRGEGGVLYNLGILYRDAKEYEKALPYFEQALMIRRELKDKRLEAFTLAELGDSSASLKNFDEAFQYYGQALVIKKEINDRHGEATVIHQIGLLQERLQQYGDTLRYFEQELTIWREIGDSEGETVALIGMGNMQFFTQQYELSLLNYNAALEVSRKTKNKKYEHLILVGLGVNYDALNKLKKARECFEQALILARESKDKTSEASTLKKLGSVYFDSGEYEKSLSFIQQALKIAIEIKDKRIEADILSYFGNTYRILKRNEEAIKYYENSLKIRQELKFRWDEMWSLVQLGRIYSDTGQYERARKCYESALAIAREVKDRRGEGVVYWCFLLLWEKLNNPKLSIIYGKQAVNTFQEIRGNIKGLEKELQKGFLANYTKVYRHLADLLISEGRLLEAQAILNLIKEEEYEELKRSGENANTMPYSQAETDVISKIEGLIALDKERTELQKLPTLTIEQEARLEKLRVDIGAANKAFDNALDALGKAEQDASTRIDEIKGGQALQSAMTELEAVTKSGVVALYTVLGTLDEKDEKDNPVRDKIRSHFGWVIMVTENGYKAYPIDVTDLEHTVFQFRNALASDKYDPQPLAAKIYNAIFRQTSKQQKRTLEGDLQEYMKSYKDKTLMWSLDGVLRYIPMSALHDGKQYLVENYRNVVFTNQSFLWLAKENQPNWLVLGLGVSEVRENFNALPGVKTELETIVREPNKHTGILNGSIKLNNDFKKQYFLNTVSGGTFPVIHIASHYSFNTAKPQDSFLLMGDGRLTFTELKENKNLFKKVDLLTLSACDTGVSGNGKEAEGFPYLAQSLGAKSVIASLWKVSDAGTPELMIQFYKLRAENPQMSKGEAFRQAQLSLLNGTPLAKPKRSQSPVTNNVSMVKAQDTNDNGASPNDKQKSKTSRDTSDTYDLKMGDSTAYRRDAAKPFSHPYYWAPFVLYGNWR